MRFIRLGSAALSFVVFFVLLGRAADSVPGKPPVGPLSPREALAHFRVLKGFKIELAAAEPEVIDPVAMAFDEDGRLYVAEMRGYPNGGVGTGQITSGKIRLLNDKDGDGVFETSTIFAEGLRFPTSVMPWKGGLLVANCPDLIYLEDANGDGKADKSRVLYTGFDVDNIQQLLSGLQWGLDNWVYGCAGGKGGTIQSKEKSDAPPVTLRGRGIRFHPETPGSLEPMSGGGQYGLSCDEWQSWFTATNSQHLRQIVLPDHYLRRNPYLPVTAVTLDIPDHGAACMVHRISPFEAWRVERTTRRKESDPKRFSSTELIPGGFITSACSPVVYTADRFPEPYRGNVFVCDPANNLIHRDLLVPNGAAFTARRADADCEFLATTDIWFRPTCLCIGPDGGLYVLDFYREAIETPLSLPEDIKKKLNLESRGRGRIWRIVPEVSSPPAKSPKPALRKAPAAELVKHLANPNSWWRFTAQRLLMERQDKSPVSALEKLARETDFAPGRAHALWTLHGLKALKDPLIENALKDSRPGVRQQGLRLAEERLNSSKSIRTLAAALADDGSPRVRFQAAFSLGEADTPETTAALAKLMRRTDNDSWTQTAVLSSADRVAPGLLEALVADRDFIGRPSAAQSSLLTRLASMVGARAEPAALARAFRLLGKQEAGAGWQVAVLEGLGQGMQNRQQPLRRLWEQPPPELKEAVEHVRPFFQNAALAARDEKRSQEERLAAVRLLGYGPAAIGAAPLEALLSPAQPGDLQLAAVRALSVQDHAQVAEVLLKAWPGAGPSLRREILEALFARTERLRAFLDAVEQKKVLAAQVESLRVDQLRKHPDAALRQRAQALFAKTATPDRQKIVADFKTALDLKADAGRGKTLFKKTCAVCHRLENEGVEVGADLLAALKNKTPEGLVIDILDPSREVDPRYINYVVSTKAGRIFTGIVAVEAPSSITLRRAEKAEDVVLRNQIEEIVATQKSLMPEDLEKQLSKQDLADVIAYLLTVAAGK